MSSLRIDARIKGRILMQCPYRKLSTEPLKGKAARRQLILSLPLRFAVTQSETWLAIARRLTR